MYNVVQGIIFEIDVTILVPIPHGHNSVIIHSGARLIYLCSFLSFLMCPCNNKSVIGMKTQVKESVIRVRVNLVGF